MKLTDLFITAISYLRQRKKRTLIKVAFALRGTHGLEIGGPSTFFGMKSSFPIYLFAKNIDGVNYSAQTIWEGTLQQGKTYNYYGDRMGIQYITEATNLQDIPNEHYDFVLSCHSLEHVANPIKALYEWKRVIKKEGFLILVLPDKRYTFDVNRPYTLFNHLVEDYKAGIDEHDTTHFEEILQYHDIQKDAGVENEFQLKEKLKDNYSKRTAHHHVFSQDVVKKMLQYCGFTLKHQQEVNSLHLITLATKQ
jgi:ubiquinone/menaquinone biosynthesis C-methylase UbiE